MMRRPLVLMLTWSVGDDLVGVLAKSEAEELARRGYRVVVLHPSDADREVQLGEVAFHSVALTMKTQTNIVTSVITALPDFARVVSGLVHEKYSPRDVAAIYSHEWIGGLLGSFIKSYLKRPLVTSMCSVESMRSSEAELLNLSIKGLELLALHHSDLIIARSSDVAVRILEEYKVPGDRVKVATDTTSAVDLVEEGAAINESADA
ncbi:MAG: glycosyltransferase family 4 protein [Candidatus Nezhaarchaeota archaeon]|nr:glycosyltransferase family 4 protein [Candidatus Nezhaarchaeota archaeon]